MPPQIPNQTRPAAASGAAVRNRHTPIRRATASGTVSGAKSIGRTRALLEARVAPSVSQTSPTTTRYAVPRPTPRAIGGMMHKATPANATTVTNRWTAPAPSRRYKSHHQTGRWSTTSHGRLNSATSVMPVVSPTRPATAATASAVALPLPAGRPA